MSLKLFRSGSPHLLNSFKKSFEDSDYKNLLSYALAQSKFETGNFTSKVFKNQNNLFGMKNATKRVQLGYALEDSEYRYYNTADDSIEDFLLWLNYVNFPKSVEDVSEYVADLYQSGYFTTVPGDYLNGLKKYL